MKPEGRTRELPLTQTSLGDFKEETLHATSTDQMRCEYAWVFKRWTVHSSFVNVVCKQNNLAQSHIISSIVEAQFINLSFFSSFNILSPNSTFPLFHINKPPLPLDTSISNSRTPDSPINAESFPDPAWFLTTQTRSHLTTCGLRKLPSPGVITTQTNRCTSVARITGMTTQIQAERFRVTMMRCGGRVRVVWDWKVFHRCWNRS